MEITKLTAEQKKTITSYEGKLRLSKSFKTLYIYYSDTPKEDSVKVCNMTKKHQSLMLDAMINPDGDYNEYNTNLTAFRERIKYYL